MSITPIRIRTGSRLHLGLLSVPGTSPGLGERNFGGVGVMIDEPAVRVIAERSRDWVAEGPSSERALAAARLACPGEDRPLRIRVEECPAEHTGLGTGTQLALAAGMAARQALGVPSDPIELAATLGRGLRSGLGVHGFARGGFLVDGGKGPASTVAPLVARHDFPGDWCVLLVTPLRERGLSGSDEFAAFAQLARRPADAAQTDALSQIVLLGLLPALVERDLAAFGEAVFEFNRRAGLLFKSSQGGEYASAKTAELIAQIRSMGIRGVGQSSWGPTVFAIGEPDRLEHAAELLRQAYTASSLVMRIVAARNRGWDS